MATLASFAVLLFLTNKMLGFLIVYLGNGFLLSAPEVFNTSPNTKLVTEKGVNPVNFIVLGPPVAGAITVILKVSLNLSVGKSNLSAASGFAIGIIFLAFCLFVAISITQLRNPRLILQKIIPQLLPIAVFVASILTIIISWHLK
ncbi:MAG: hypothetical protein ABIV39_05355 [Verrucomicrobiota bacterium]